MATYQATRERLGSLDTFRGLTIAGMLLVNNPGSWGNIFPPLAHAEWNGWTPTDLIFPFFLFIVGITTHLSLESRRARGATDRELVLQVLRRGLIIIGLGVALNLFPYMPVDWRLGPLHLVYPADRLVHFRVPGVLQRIGVAYLCTGLITLHTTLRQQLLIVVALLFGYWLVMTVLPVPDSGLMGALTLGLPGHTLAAWVDRAVFRSHVWAATATWDPEGLLSTFPAIATTMLGVFAGRWIAARRPLPETIAALFAAGALATVLGLMWAWSFPINKNLWTSSYVLFTGGVAALTLATCMWVIDDRRIAGWTTPFIIFGVNPIVAFVGSGVMGRLVQTIIRVRTTAVPAGETPLQLWVYDAFVAMGLAPRVASLLFAVAVVLLWLAILAVLYRRNIVLKV